MEVGRKKVNCNFYINYSTSYSSINTKHSGVGSRGEGMKGIQDLAPRSCVFPNITKNGNFNVILLPTFHLYFLCIMQFKKPKLLQFRPLVTITILGCAEQLQSCYYTLQQVLRLPIWCHKGINVKKRGGCIHYISRA